MAGRGELVSLLLLSLIFELCLGKEFLCFVLLLFDDEGGGGGGAGRFTFGGLLTLLLALADLKVNKSSDASLVFIMRSAFSHNFMARSHSFSAAACLAFFIERHVTKNIKN